MALKRDSRFGLAAVALVNILCIAFLLGLLVYYNGVYQKRLTEQNLNDIAHLNESSINVATAYYDSMEQRLAASAAYIKQQGLTEEEALAYLACISVSGESHYQLLRQDGTGFQAASGTHVPVDYGEHYEQLTLLEKAGSASAGGMTPEFTDQVTRVKSFAAYCYVPVKTAGGEIAYGTLMLLSRASDFERVIKSAGGYHGIAVALMQENGDYIVNSAAFKSQNFFQYLKSFNELTLDEMNAIKDSTIASGEGNLFYRNALGQDCVFSYRSFPTRDWYAVTCVPLDSFTMQDMDLTYTAVAVVVLAMMALTDILYLASLNRKMRRSAQNEAAANRAKSDFFSRMSHDMRTPMNVILGLTTLMKEHTDLQEMQEDVDQIHLSGQYLLNLINDSLDVSRIEAGKMELHPSPIDGRRVMSNILSTAKLMADRAGVILVTSAFSGEESEPKKWVPVMADESRLEQIFMNLISNAVKFTPREKSVELIANVLSETDETIKEEYIIRDHGIGMSEEFLPHLFEPFSQEGRINTDYQSGTGLGMSIVRQVITLMGGSIEVKSRLNEGTEFRVVLEYPVYHGRAAVPSEAVLADVSLAGLRMLLAEDNAVNRMIAVKLLEKQGIVVECAENGQLALEMFRAAAAGYYSAILMDVRMPVMDGIAATRAIRAEKRPDAVSIPIIAMTANAFEEDVRACLEAGMNAHLAKPIETECLFAALVKYCAPQNKNK